MHEEVGTVCAECAKKDEEIAKLKRQHREFKVRIRDRAIREADARGWCGEFDQIIKQYGLAGRWAEYDVTVRWNGWPMSVYSDRRGYTNREEQGQQTHTHRCLAKNQDHAITLVMNHLRRVIGHPLEVIAIKRVERPDEIESEDGE